MKSAGWVGAGIGLAAAAYGSYVAVTWCRYGRQRRTDSDPILDRFMPVYEVAERHHIRVDAPVEVTLAAACEMDLQQSRIIRTIFRTREFLLRSQVSEKLRPERLLEQMKALGWNMLAEIPGREIVMGAVTQPWAAKVVFRPVPAAEFAGFAEPGFVKILWTLRADPIAARESIFRTETRATATDPATRAKFRVYWAFFSPGIKLIRRLSLGPLKAEAERRASVYPAASRKLCTSDSLTTGSPGAP
jgi:hypothetical protein